MNTKCFIRAVTKNGFDFKRLFLYIDDARSPMCKRNETHIQRNKLRVSITRCCRKDGEDGTEVTLSSLFYLSHGYVAISAGARGVVYFQLGVVCAYRIYVENRIQLSRKTTFEIASWHECETLENRLTIESYTISSRLRRKATLYS